MHTDEQLLKALAAVIRKTGAYPQLARSDVWSERSRVIADWEGFSLASPELYEQRFGSIEKAVHFACEMAGLAVPDGALFHADYQKHYGARDLEEAIVKVALAMGEMPKSIGGHDWHPRVQAVAEEIGVKLASLATYQQRGLGTRALPDLFKRHGVVVKKRTYSPYATEEIIDAFRRFHEAFGHYPKRGTINRKSWRPEDWEKAERLGIKLVLPSTLFTRLQAASIAEAWEIVSNPENAREREIW